MKTLFPDDITLKEVFEFMKENNYKKIKKIRYQDHKLIEVEW